MLVLGRKPEERLTITTRTGEVITILVVSTKPGYVRLGVDAPRDFLIARDNAKTGEKP